MQTENSGHRERLRKRFLENDHNALADHELLELLLFGVIPRRDVKPIAKRMLNKFGNINAVIGAPFPDLIKIEGVGEGVAAHLKAVHAVLVRAELENVKDKPILDSWSSLLSYLRIDLTKETREQFRVLFLDKKLRLIKDEMMGDGTIDQAPVYPREIARRCLELAACSVVLVHNHPSGDPKASQQDIVMTRKIVLALQQIEVNVIDHLIVGEEGTTSMKAIGLI